MSDEISERLHALITKLDAQFPAVEAKLAEAMAAESKNAAALAVIGGTLHDLTARLHHQDSRIVELMARVAGLEALCKAQPEITRRLAAVEALAGIRAGHMGAHPADSDAMTLTEHRPNAPR